MLSLPDPAMFSGFGALQTTVDRSVASLQAILRALGAPVGSDGTYGPTTSGAWVVLSSALKLDPLFQRVTSQVVRVSGPTLQRLATEAALRKGPKPAGTDDFERLNNAIVQASRLGGAWDALARDWQDGTGPVRRSLLMAVPTVWAGVLERFWDRYRQLWTPAVWDKVVPPADKEVRDYYEQNKDKIHMLTGKQIAFKDIEQQLKMRMTQEKRRDLYLEYAKGLKAKAKITVNDKAVETAMAEFTKPADLSGMTVTKVPAAGKEESK